MLLLGHAGEHSVWYLRKQWGHTYRRNIISEIHPVFSYILCFPHFFAAWVSSLITLFTSLFANTIAWDGITVGNDPIGRGSVLLSTTTCNDHNYFRCKNISCKIFRAFNCRTGFSVWKYFYTENFDIHVCYDPIHNCWLDLKLVDLSKTSWPDLKPVRQINVQLEDTYNQLTPLGLKRSSSRALHDARLMIH